ncbi:MAG: bifunctional glutamate N-acetyltransferase/amino-acid acetyltransferase ArgJ [Moraxellaceae bacterium]|nr:bifunctional glutamate N-acetyltransferase/amino-acid acetyltransferase ArgJ [Pseudobdellovibrionaceae bacterium]
MTPGPGLNRTLLPKGFSAGAINSGVRRYRPDLGIIISDVPSVAAGVFTLNQCKAAPVIFSQARVPSDNIRAIITNSGQANAATGDTGFERNLMMVSAAAKSLGCSIDQVLVASTGVIGHQLDTDKILPAIPELIERAHETAEAFASAIMTTDLVPKTATNELQLSSGSVRITGISKGSGMIHPNMATMLGYIISDVKISKDFAHICLKTAVDMSFNMISVDGDSSTNDCCFLMANGASGVELKTEEDILKFQTAVNELSIFLAKSIAADGEGASKLVEVEIIGSDDKEIAKRAARGVTLSPLIKTALHGEDPNWGRILARLGAEQVPADQLAKMSLSLQGVKIFENGQPLAFVRDEVKALLKQSNIFIKIDLKSGDVRQTAWGCDLSKKYVEINTEYS